MYPKSAGDKHNPLHNGAPSCPQPPPYSMDQATAPPAYASASAPQTLSQQKQVLYPGNQLPQGTPYGGVHYPSVPHPNMVQVPYQMHQGQPGFSNIAPQGPPPSYVGGPPYPTGYCPPPAYQSPLHVTHQVYTQNGHMPVVSFDAGARFGGKGGGSVNVPPPPPGYAPTAAQVAAMQGQKVLMEKKRTKFW